MTKKKELQIEYLNVDALKPYEKNAKDHDEHDVNIIAQSIETYGMNDPIGIWGKDNVIVEGHGRLMACKQLGIETVPVIRLDHLSSKQRREYAILHNKTVELSTWNDYLKEEYNDLPGLELYDIDFGDIYDSEDDEDDGYYGDERERTFNSTNLQDFNKALCAGKYEMPVIK